MTPLGEDNTVATALGVLLRQYSLIVDEDELFEVARCWLTLFNMGQTLVSRTVLNESVQHFETR
jgi:hypothetical protein